MKSKAEAQRVLNLCSELWRRDTEDKERVKISLKQKEEKKNVKRQERESRGERERRRSREIQEERRERGERKRKESKALQASIIIKSDVAGSLEAVEEILVSNQPAQMKVEIIQTGVGNVIEDDIEVAETFNGMIHTYIHNVVNTCIFF